MRSSVSAIVPVYNEEKTVAKVLETLLASPLFIEVIAVSDGSTDRSPEIVRGFGERVKFIEHRKNRGKGNALAAGIRAARGDIVSFWDADLLTLSQKHIESLIEPIASGKAEAVLGFPSLKIPKLSPFRYLTGERAYYREDILPHADEMEKLRFGVEVYLNDVFKDKKTLHIPWKDLRGLYKHEKFDPRTAVKEYLKEAVEITKTLSEQNGIGEVDNRVLARLSKAQNLGELRAAIAQIGNQDVRDLWEKYILRYIRFPAGRKKAETIKDSA